MISWPIDWKIWVSSVDRSLYWSGGQSVERLVGRSARRLVRAIGLWNDGAVDLMVDGSSNQSVDRLVGRPIVQGQLGSWPDGIAVGRSKLQAAQCNRCKRIVATYVLLYTANYISPFYNFCTSALHIDVASSNGINCMSMRRPVI